MEMNSFEDLNTGTNTVNYGGANDFWSWYYDNGIIPNIWKGITGQSSANRNTDKTNSINKQIADENLQHQKDLFEYNKALQNQLFEREDTAYQRTAEDMRAAGLNPLSMNSTNGAGEVVGQSPLNNQFRAETPQIMNPSSAISALSSVFSAIDGIKTGKLERDSLALENDRKQIENLARITELGAEKTGNGYQLKDDNRYEKVLSKELETLENTTNKSRSESELTETSSKNAIREYEHKVESGKYDSDSSIESYLTAIEDWVLSGRGASAFEKLKENSALANSVDKANELLQAPKKRYKEIQKHNEDTNSKFENWARKNKFGNWLMNKYDKFSSWAQEGF